MDKIGDFELNKIYNEDCVNILKQLPDKCIDLVITDPPYGKKWTRGLNGIGMSKTKNESDKCVWDNVPSKEVFDEIIRVSKNQIIFGFNHFMEYLPSTNCIIVWNKKGNKEDKIGIFADCELAWTSFNKVIKKYDVRVMGFINDNEIMEKRIHPTQKPLKLIKSIIKDFSKEGDIIADFFSGSGVVGLCCKDYNRKFLCVEADKGYYDDSMLLLNKKNKEKKLSF